MLAIWKREFQNYFLTPIGYVFMAVFLLAGGIFFLLYNVIAATNSLSTMFGNLSYLFMMIVPVLTMKLLAEEKRTKTDQLLLTSPLSITSIVCGKFLAAVSVFALSLLGTAFCIIVIVTYGKAYWGLIFSNYLGYFLMGCTYIAIGVFMSAVTENQVSAAVLTFGVNLGVQIIESVASYLVFPTYLDWISSVLNWFSLYRRYYTFTAGVVSLADVIYYLTFIGLMLFFTVRVVDKRRWSEG
ncbi:MAG: ABC transporter permease [Eubacteriales bacterium]|nr:ABC transporter permease [Eubacteriales bacterium]